MNDKKIQVANIVETPHFGGPQKRIILVSKYLKQKNIETMVIIPKAASSEFFLHLKANGIKYISVSLHRLTKNIKLLLKYFLYFIPEILVLYRILKSEEVDIVHCNGVWQLKGIIAGKLAGKKTIWHLNDTHMPFLFHVAFRAISYKFCDAFIVAGKRVKNYYINSRNLKKKIIVEIQAPVDTSVFNPEKVSTSKLIDRFEGIKIITVGNISPVKDFETFIEMARLLNKNYDYKNITFVVVGKILDSQLGYYQKLRSISEKYNLSNLYFLTNVDRVEEVLSGTDIYVCTSVSEASPMSIWEAMSMSKPIVSTDVGDVKEYISNGINGYIVNTKDPEALAKSVSILIDNPELRNKMGLINRDIAVRYFDIKKVVERHYYIYKKLIDTNKQ